MVVTNGSYACLTSLKLYEWPTTAKYYTEVVAHVCSIHSAYFHEGNYGVHSSTLSWFHPHVCMYVFHCSSWDQKCSLSKEGTVQRQSVLGTLVVPIWGLSVFA